MIYILEGPDGVGKTTLANEIAEQKKASVLHAYFDKDWDIQQHHQDLWEAARKISKWKPVVLDRWAHSELIYGSVFRDGPVYDVISYVDDMIWPHRQNDITWIYCRSDNTAKRHDELKKIRHEMFDDMTEVANMYDDFIASDTEHKWITYDFDKVDMKEFVRGLPA